MPWQICAVTFTELSETSDYLHYIVTVGIFFKCPHRLQAASLTIHRTNNSENTLVCKNISQENISKEINFYIHLGIDYFVPWDTNVIRTVNVLIGPEQKRRTQ